MIALSIALALSLPLTPLDSLRSLGTSRRRDPTPPLLALPQPFATYDALMDFSMFFLQLSVGILGLTPLVAWKAVGKGYYLTNLAIGLAFLPFAWFFRASAMGPENFPVFDATTDGIVNFLVVGYGVLALVAVMVFWVGKGRPGAWLTGIASILGWAAVLVDGARQAGLTETPAATTPLLALNYLAGAGVPVQPLKLLTILFFVFLGLRLALVGVAVAMDPAGASEMADRSFIFLVVRGLFGLGAPIAMSWMIWGTVAIRSTQAATGILYGVCCFVLMGEAAARFILLTTGFPV
ncbi:MAG: hypothetical protein ACYTDX_03980 [Planctomycetota bacterium]